MFQVHTKVCVGEVSILPTFYIRAAFLFKSVPHIFFCSQFVFVFFWQKESGTKATRKILAKLTTGVNSINIEQAAFLYKSVLHSFYLISVWHCNFLAK